MTTKTAVLNKDGSKKEVAKSDGTMSERFTNAVMKEFGNIAGAIEFSPLQKRLAQHLFIKIDTSLGELEKKRQEKNPNNTPIVWANVNMTKLALDSVHRIELELDALIPNHISVIPYYNTRMQKYDIDLRVGYVGKDYYRRKMAVEPPLDIRYQLVYETDVFEPLMKSKDNPVETYVFKIPKPFARGKIVGAYGYIVYKDENKNQLVLVTDEDFKKAEAKAQSKEFWGGYTTEMKYKTLVIRTTNKIQIDSTKVNASFMAVELDDASDAAAVHADIDEKANKGAVIDIPASDVHEEPHQPNDQGTPGRPETPVPTPPTCVCEQMTQDGMKEWDCPLHGRYQGGKFTPPAASPGLFDQKPQGRKPTF